MKSKYMEQNSLNPELYILSGTRFTTKEKIFNMLTWAIIIISCEHLRQVRHIFR